MRQGGVLEGISLWFCYIYSIGESQMSDIVDSINKEFDEYQSLLCLKEKKLKLLVDLGNDEECDNLISLLGEIKDKNIVL